MSMLKGFDGEGSLERQGLSINLSSTAGVR